MLVLMKLKFSRIIDNGSLENERLLFTVNEACNLGNYVIALAKKMTGHRISSQLENIKWLEDAEVKPQDIVVVYTYRKGEGVKTIQNKSGQTSYFLFWNLSNILMELGDNSVVYFETSWKTIDVSEVINEASDSSEGE